MRRDIFIHLDVHSEYSLVDGIVRIKPMIAALRDKSDVCIALTDQMNMFAAVKYFKAATDSGIKPIFGATLEIDYSGDVRYSVVALCKDYDHGYHNLSVLLSGGYLSRTQDNRVSIDHSELITHSDGLIFILYPESITDDDCVPEVIQSLEASAPNSLYLGVSRIGGSSEDSVIQTIDLAKSRSLPVVATNKVRFLRREDYEAHEVRVCIGESDQLHNPSRESRYTEEQYLKSSSEMIELFSDIPSAIENTIQIAKRCNMVMSLGGVHLPDYPIPDGFNPDTYIKHLASTALDKYLDEQCIPTDKHPAYRSRLDNEIDVICRMGFPGYFLIVSDFIKWSRENDVPVGPGRGSGAGSLVAFMLRITDLDPIEHELLFERFLNPERVSMPDFDVDFCMDKRDRVIDYVASKYGRDKVSQIITFGTMAAKAVIRDVGRVLGHPYGFVDEIARMIPSELGTTLSSALRDEDKLRSRYDEDEDVRTLMDIALKLEGIVRQAGKHAGGVVIASSAMTDFTPLYCDDKGSVVTQFDKDDVESVGLIKFDFLGLRTLTIIDHAVKVINQEKEKEGLDPISIDQIPIDDKNTYDLLKNANTKAVFQLESHGMRELIAKIQPDNFEEITALVALYRPGPLQSGMVDDFIARKHGLAEIDYPHPDIVHILEPTYGVILYQEQVMQIAQVLANYSLGGADLLRRAMGKKKPEEMAKQREVFVNGAKLNNVDSDLSGYIFDLIEKFAGYGFNKSHSAAYALIAYQTAWLKANYPEHFMAATMSADMDETDKLMNLVDECRKMGLRVLPPMINKSAHHFRSAKRQILYGLGAIKGVGRSVVDNIIKEREESGPYTDLFQFAKRTASSRVNTNVMMRLGLSGALDQLGEHRHEIVANIPQAVAYGQKCEQDALTGQFDLFSLADGEDINAPRWHRKQPWPLTETLSGEMESLGLYFSGHPVDQYRHLLDKAKIKPISAITGRNGSKLRICALLQGIKSVRTRHGDTMGFITLDDGTDRLEAAMFPDTYKESIPLLKENSVIVAEVYSSKDRSSGDMKYNIEAIYPPESVL